MSPVTHPRIYSSLRVMRGLSGLGPSNRMRAVFQTVSDVDVLWKRGWETGLRIEACTGFAFVNGWVGGVVVDATTSVFLSKLSFRFERAGPDSLFKMCSFRGSRWKRRCYARILVRWMRGVPDWARIAAGARVRPERHREIHGFVRWVVAGMWECSLPFDRHSERC
jgi:hypothetical protein